MADYIIIREINDPNVKRALKRVSSIQNVTPSDIKGQVTWTTCSRALVDRLSFEPNQMTVEQVRAVLGRAVAYPIENDVVYMDRPVYGPR